MNFYDLLQQYLENLFTFFEIIAFKLLAKKRGIELKPDI